MITCPDCGTEHYPGILFCDICGAAVHPAARAHLAATRPPGQTVAGPKTATSSASHASSAPTIFTPPPTTVARPRALRVRLPHHDAEFILTGEVIEVGRADPDEGHVPQLDLTNYGGQDRGVSRRHATIQWVEGAYVVIDRHSSNGTWLNGMPLVAGYAYQIPPGANVRFGGLVVQLSIAD